MSLTFTYPLRASCADRLILLYWTVLVIFGEDSKRRSCHYAIFYCLQLHQRALSLSLSLSLRTNGTQNGGVSVQVVFVFG